MPIARSSDTPSAFTIATGRTIYLEMACSLARSFRLWHKEDEFRFFLATDTSTNNLPKDLRNLSIIPLKSDEFGKGFSPKLYLDKIAPTARSMFIDADCLCCGSLRNAFKRFKGHAVSVIGSEINHGEWFGDIGKICKKLNLSKIPKFNGGLYYLEKGIICTAVYSKAREMQSLYDSLGFMRLRGHANDEVLMSVAMAFNKQKPIRENGDIMNTLLAGPGGVEIDVFKGKAILKNPKLHPKHNPWYELQEMRPKLVHFLGTDISTYPYRHENIRLRMVCEKKWSVIAATLWAYITFTWPWKTWQHLKNNLRPIYHVFFGARRVKSTRHFS